MSERSALTTMSCRLAALILLSALYQTMSHQISVTVNQPGDDVNMVCLIMENKVGLFYWYKLKFGNMVEKVSGGSFQSLKLEEQFRNSRFEVTQEETVTGMDTLFSLNIRNVSKEDEATYFCQAGSAYEMKVINTTLLNVNDHKNHQRSVYVSQRPETQSVQEGASVDLQCSLLYKYKETRVQCPDEHSVYWFRAGFEESHRGVIYTHNNMRFKQGERSCVYSLSKTIQDSSDEGTYYCAVATCGEILFGEGTTVETRSSKEGWTPVVVFLGSLLAICVLVIVVLIFSRK